MVLHRSYEDHKNVPDFDYMFDELQGLPEEEAEHRKEVRRLLEERLEQKRLKDMLADDFEDLC